MIKKYPWYLKITVILLGLILFSFILSELRDILIPLSFALFLAILLNPLVALMEGWKIPKTWAIIFSLLAAVLVIAAIGYFLSMQMSNFTDQMPLLKKKSVRLVIFPSVPPGERSFALMKLPPSATNCGSM